MKDLSDDLPVTTAISEFLTLAVTMSTPYQMELPYAAGQECDRPLPPVANAQHWLTTVITLRNRYHVL